MRQCTHGIGAPPLLSVMRILSPDTDRDNRALRGRGKCCARLVLCSKRARRLLHEVDRACVYGGGPLLINRSVFELDRDEEREHALPSRAVSRSLCVRLMPLALVSIWFDQLLAFPLLWCEGGEGEARV